MPLPTILTPYNAQWLIAPRLRRRSGCCVPTPFTLERTGSVWQHSANGASHWGSGALINIHSVTPLPGRPKLRRQTRKRCGFPRSLTHCADERTLENVIFGGELSWTGPNHLGHHTLSCCWSAGHRIRRFRLVSYFPFFQPFFWVLSVSTDP